MMAVPYRFLGRWGWGLVACLALGLFIGACRPLSDWGAPTYTLAPTLTPTPTHTITPISTKTPTPTPIPSSTPPPPPTPLPTLQPSAVETPIAKVQARLAQANVTPLCLRWEDTDLDGEPEWLGAYLQPGEPSQLKVFILDGETWHDLEAPPAEPGKVDYGLGQYPTCEIEVRDANVDGRAEIIIWGRAEESVDLLHLFVWDGASYRLLGAFVGDAGIRMQDADGDLADEISVRYKAGGGLVWEAVHIWDGANYGWSWERYDWFYLSRPHVYRTDTPERAVISFYLAINDRDLPGAYQLLSQTTQAEQPYETWALGFATTMAVEVGVVHEIERSDDAAVVAAQALSYDNVDGRVAARLWDVSWRVVQTADGWRCVSATTELLDSWDAPYYR